MSLVSFEPSVLSRFQGALGGLLWGCDGADRSRLAYHLGQAVSAAIALDTRPIALTPQMPLALALALTLPWALLSFDQSAYEDAFAAIVADHGDREVLWLWRRLLLQGLGGEPATSWLMTALAPSLSQTPSLSQALKDSLDALVPDQPFCQPLGQVLDRIQSQPELTIAERSLVQAIGLGRALQGQIALLDRYSQRQRSLLEAASRPLLFSLMGATGCAPDAPIGPLGLEAQGWGESLLRSWAGILRDETRSSDRSSDSRRSSNQAGVPGVNSGIQSIRL